MLGDNPRPGRARPEIRPGIHAFVHKAHIVFYDIDVDRVVIQRVLHHSMAIEPHIGCGNEGGLASKPEAEVGDG